MKKIYGRNLRPQKEMWLKMELYERIGGQYKSHSEGADHQ